MTLHRSDFVSCPLCHACIRYERKQHGEHHECPYCQQRFLRTSWDTGGHQLKDLRRRIPSLLGMLVETLHPIGTQVCFNCGMIYPQSFTTCPRLMLMTLNFLRKKRQQSDLRVTNFAWRFVEQHNAVMQNVATRLLVTRKLNETDSLIAELKRRTEIELPTIL